MFHIVDKYRPLLNMLRLSSLKEVTTFSAAQVKDQRGRRDVLRVPITTPDGTTSSLFIKRLWKSRLKDSLFSLVRRARVWSKARTEFHYYQVLRSRGIRTARPVAFGEECTALTERFSVIITESAPGLPFDDWLATHPPTIERRQQMYALGQWVAQLHERGIAFPDLFARHIFYDRSAKGAADTFVLIDVARLNVRSHPISTALRARDLAALCAGTPLHACTLRDRLRLLKQYTPEKAERKKLKTRIERRMHTLLKRSKFADFATQPPAERAPPSN